MTETGDLTLTTGSMSMTETEITGETIREMKEETIIGEKNQEENTMKVLRAASMTTNRVSPKTTTETKVIGTEAGAGSKTEISEILRGRTEGGKSAKSTENAPRNFQQKSQTQSSNTRKRALSSSMRSSRKCLL